MIRFQFHAFIVSPPFQCFPHHMNEQIESLSKAVHQKRLERLERLDFAGTALLDGREPEELGSLDHQALDTIQFLEEE